MSQTDHWLVQEGRRILKFKLKLAGKLNLGLGVSREFKYRNPMTSRIYMKNQVCYNLGESAIKNDIGYIPKGNPDIQH